MNFRKLGSLILILAVCLSTPAFAAKVPSFSIPALNSSSNMTNHDFKSCSLLTIWASWCPACKYEHSYMMTLSSKIPMYAIAYQDDHQNLKTLLAERGNPYRKIGFDDNGAVADKFHTTGVPETLLIDKSGEILYHLHGVMTQEIWQQDFLPLISKHCK